MRPVLSLLALAAAATFPAWPVQAQAPGGGAPPAVTVAKPVVKEVGETDEFTGRFEAVDAVEIRARVSGYLEKVGFADGAIVKKGDVLFVIDRRPYRATLDQAEANLASAKARVTFAKSDLDRGVSLQRSGNISEQIVDQRQQSYTSARADQDASDAALRNAQLNYDFTEIRAPLTGRIGRKLISEGNLVNANETLLTTIVSLDPIYFYFDVDERSFLTFDRNRTAARAAGRELTAEARVGVTDEREAKRPARLDFLDNRIDPASGTIRARAIVPNADLFLVPGLFGRIQVAGSAPYRGILVPDEAIATDQDRRLVWVVAEDNSVSARVVRPGPRIDGYRVIRSGLTGEETIVVNGLQRVRPGAKVTPQRQDLPPTRS